MAHISLHFCAGLLLGTMLLPLFLHRMQRDPVSRLMLNWISTSFLLGFFAMIPHVLMRIGLPLSFCQGWWMNIFLFSPLLDALKHGGQLVGQLGIAVAVVVQYTVLLTVLWRVRRCVNNGLPINENINP